MVFISDLSETQEPLLWRNRISRHEEVEGKEEYQVRISNSFALLENVDDDVNINMAWETIRENITFQRKRV
jgi:hypothetical protein